MSEEQNKIKAKINKLRKLHSELDMEISKIVKVIPVDQVMLQRIKKKKLKLKEEYEEDDNTEALDDPDLELLLAEE